MSSSTGNAKNLDSSRAEALQGLLRSLEHTNDGSEDAPLSADQVQRLSKKINEILGDAEDRDQTPGALPSQLLNEEGLPIIDISEPVDDESQLATSFPVPDQELIPLHLLSPQEREWRRHERDRILDLLEEEERLQQLQEERDAEEERREALKKRKESAKAELEQLKAARNLQKKMGQALVRSTKDLELKDNACSDPQNTASAGKKSVSFADAPSVEEDEKGRQLSLDWGDVVPGRLRARRRVPPLANADEEKYPMKMRVVERHPGGENPTPPSLVDADSDDEPASTESPSRLQNTSSDEEATNSSNSNDLSDGEPLEEGFDYDIAQHRREIALEYHRKRNTISAEATEAMSTVTLNDVYEQQGTTKEQSPLSRFRADRMAAAYDKSHDPVSTSIGQTIIPASRQKSLRNSVRLGKLEDDQLVGGASGESGSEDETVKEVIQMLKTGKIQNVGPDFESSSFPSISVAPPGKPDLVGPPSIELSTTYETKQSKFKLARGGGITATNSIRDDNTKVSAPSQPAISSVVERKAPRSFPINKPPSQPATEKTSQQAFPMIIDSPSFPATSRVSPRDPERPSSRFVVERKK